MHDELLSMYALAKKLEDYCTHALKKIIYTPVGSCQLEFKNNFVLGSYYTSLPVCMEGAVDTPAVHQQNALPCLRWWLTSRVTRIDLTLECSIQTNLFPKIFYTNNNLR
jgi:hypothetical protein